MKRGGCFFALFPPDLPRRVGFPSYLVIIETVEVIELHPGFHEDTYEFVSLYFWGNFLGIWVHPEQTVFVPLGAPGPVT